MTKSTIMPDASTFDDQTPLYCSTILSNYVGYLQSHHPDVDIDALLHCSGINRSDLNDESHFLTQNQVNTFHRCLDERLSDPSIAYKVGRHALYMKSTGTVMQYGLQFITPQTMYKAVDRIYPKWSLGHRSRTTITGRSQAEVVISVHPGVREAPFQCENRRGIFEAVAKIQTGQPAQVDHPQCMHRGDQACVYRVAWKEKPSSIWKRRCAYVGHLFLILGLSTPFFLSAVPWTMLILAMGMAYFGLLLHGSLLERKELAGFLKSQGDVAGHLLQEIETRHYNTRLVQEIGKASADILEVNPFLDSVLKSIVRSPYFTRGMIALCEGEGSRFRLVANHGFSESELRDLEKLWLRMERNPADDTFSRSLKRGRPLSLTDIHDRTAPLSPDDAGTLISVPLIRKRERIGLLFVDTKGEKRDVTAIDMNLLEGIGSHIATGIVNARSYSRLQESEQRYRLLAENVADVIWILDFETMKMRYISPSVEDVQGYTPDEIMALSLDRYLPPPSFQRVTAALSQALEWTRTGKIDPKNYSTTLELEEYHKNGSVVPIEVTAGFIVGESGRPDAVLGISRNLSERKRADLERTEMANKLQQSNKMESLGTMAGSIAHNFNNLLMVVLGNLELAKEDLTDPSTTLTNVQRAINATQRAADLSGMMLTYVGQLKKESVPVDLSQVVQTALGNMDEPTMANVELELDLADPMPLVIADLAQMRQMISGFVTNAIEALRNRSGRVRITTGSMDCDKAYLSTTYLKEEMPEGRYAFVEVADTGCGMDGETLGKVFDPFFSTKFTGRGLGMAAVMGIIRSHGGAVKVVSVKDEGSVFTALFPVKKLFLRNDRPEPAHMETVSAGKTVLLVDDDPMVMDVGSQFLERLGYQVLTASSGQQALDILDNASDPIDCVLLDFTMPGMDGLETMRQIKTMRPAIRILIASGYTRQQIEDRFSDAEPPDDFIQKPFEMKALQEKLGRVIGNHR